MSAAVASKNTDVESTGTSHISANVGRIQVSGNRLRRFYVFAARRSFASNPQMTKIHITALGSAITSAIGIAHELMEMQVATISSVQTYYQPLKASEADTPSTKPEHASHSGRSIARILIVVDRNPSWSPEDSDLRRPSKRVSDAAAAPSANGAPAATAATTPAPTNEPKKN